jgi:hypothetical protein
MATAFDVLKTLCNHEWKASGRYHADRTMYGPGRPGPIWGTVYRCTKCSKEDWVEDGNSHEGVKGGP